MKRSTNSGDPCGFDPKTSRAWIEIDLDHLTHNAKVLQAAMPRGCRLMAVVKDQAYGHGALKVAAHLNKIGVKAFAVATLEEGIALRRQGIRGEILILGYTDAHFAGELERFDLMQTIPSEDYARAISQQGKRIQAHLKIDTGMHRLGLPFQDVEAVKRMFALPPIRVTGMYTHLCCADSLLPEDVRFTKEQISRFYQVVDALKANGMPVPKLHIQSSYGLLNYPYLTCDYARIGIALYGVHSAPCCQTVLKLALRPVLSLKARVVHIQTVPKGESVGYGRAFVAQQESRIAILPIGYGDGLPRNLSCGRGSVWIGGQLAPIVGRICMDQLAVDITGVKDVSLGDIATLITNTDEGCLTAPLVADASQSISNELLCRMGARLPVVEVTRQKSNNTKAV